MEPTAHALSVLIIADDAQRRKRLLQRLNAVSDWRLEAESAPSDHELWERLAVRACDIVFLDERVGTGHVLEILEKLRQLHPKSAVVVAAASGNDKQAVAAMKAGAMDYLTDAEM